MVNLTQIQTDIIVAEKLIPIVEGIVRELQPTVVVVGADAGVVASDAAKLLTHLKEKIVELKGIVSAAAQPPPTSAA